VDIRRFPGSRRFPHFNQQSLASAVQNAGLEYHWLADLGGRRRKIKEPSPNVGLENDAFRSYADYMLTDEFRQAVKKLREIARRKRVAIMCAEAVFWRCHRRLVSDFLVANGAVVQHIMPSGELQPHMLTRAAVVGDRRVTYPGEKLLFA
jgi:uncharacterized protein (DUF488 family)